MHCPVCFTTLRVATLESSLRAYTCRSCGGHFILSSDYLDWRLQQKTILSAQPDPRPLPATSDTKCAKRCPHCKHLMLPYKVGHGITFHLDHCGSCNSVWFDRNEWASLKRCRLHDDVHRMFSEAWQRRIREAEHQATMQTIYRKKFGEADYAEAQRVRAWLDAHPHQHALRAYLNAEDPYD